MQEWLSSVNRRLELLERHGHTQLTLPGRSLSYTGDPPPPAAGPTRVFTTPTLVNGFAWYAGPTWQQHGYVRLGCGLVVLTGLLGTATVVPANSLTMFTLPVGHRPRAGLHFQQGVSAGTEQSGFVQVLADGRVTFRFMNNGTGPVTWVTLDGVAFVAEA